MLMKEIKDIHKRRHILCSWIGRHSIAKVITLLKLIYRYNAIPIQMLATFFIDIDNLFLKYIWKGKGPTIAKTIFKRKKEGGGITLPNVKANYRAPVLKTVWYWEKDGSIENPEIILYKYVQIILTKMKTQFNEGSITFQQMVLELLDIHRPNK